MKSWLSSSLLLGALSASAAPLGVVVPAYFYPTISNYWSVMNYAAPRVPLIVILNPNSGPGTSQDANFVTVVSNLHAAGGKTIGYIATGYTTTNLAQVEACVDRYLSFYTVDGFFFDEMSNDADTNHLDYYAALYQYVKNKNTNFIVMGNPGTDTLEEYLTRPTADIVMNFETDTGYLTFTPSSWVTNHLARQFVHAPYNVTNATTMSNYVNLAISRNAGWVYITDDKGANPYDTLPTYWTNEVNFLQSLNQTAPATRIALNGITNKVPTLKITGAPGAYELQATSNLSSWSAVRVLNTTTGTGTVSDVTATNRTAIFYRTRQ